MAKKRRLISKKEFKELYPCKNLTEVEVTEMIASLEELARITYKFTTMKK